MSGDLDIELDRAYVDDQVRADALAYLQRTGNDDLADVLGLVDERPELKPFVILNGRSHCATCRMQVRADGICRRVVCAAGRPDVKAATTTALAGLCGLCNNPLPRSGVCRKTLRCRTEAARKEMEAQ